MNSSPEQIVEWKKTILAALPKEDIAATLALSCLLQELINTEEELFVLAARKDAILKESRSERFREFIK